MSVSGEPGGRRGSFGKAISVSYGGTSAKPKGNLNKTHQSRQQEQINAQQSTKVCTILWIFDVLLHTDICVFHLNSIQREIFLYKLMIFQTFCDFVLISEKKKEIEQYEKCLSHRRNILYLFQWRDLRRYKIHFSI